MRADRREGVAKNEGLLLGAAGTATATMEVKGRAAHAGAAPELGRNALIELAHQLLQTRDVAKGVPGAQLNWTDWRGPAWSATRSRRRAVATGDVRITAPAPPSKLHAALQAQDRAGRLVPDTETTVTLQVGRPPFLANERGARARRSRRRRSTPSSTAVSCGWRR